MDNYNTDEHGYLLDYESWDMDFCNLLAEQE
ncbi:sulfurtransferase TusE, partial [Francisella tularensis subsp. holarctica]|nr:sulfurtransferase TusE [Francisella tularensis subsp. holarctica]